MDLSCRPNLSNDKPNNTFRVCGDVIALIYCLATILGPKYSVHFDIQRDKYWINTKNENLLWNQKNSQVCLKIFIEYLIKLYT